MSFGLSFKMAISSILSNKLRTFLTMLGVIIGVSAVIIAVGFAEGSTKSITSNEDYYRVTSQQAMLETLSSVTDTLSIVLAGIAAISLVVGGIGIMNIMIVSVTERTREIGIRKAIGARKINILIQFLIESLIITLLGGITGIIIGCLGITIIGKLDLVPAVYSIKWILISLIVSLLIGVVFGLFPAYKAAKMDPIKALRTN